MLWNRSLTSKPLSIVRNFVPKLQGTFFIFFYLGGLEISNCIELYIISKLKISSFRIWLYLKIHIRRLFGGFVMQGHIWSFSAYEIEAL